MRVRTALFVGLAVLGLSPWAQDCRRQISTKGVFTQTVQPDSLELTIKVFSVGATLKESSDANDHSIEALFAELKALGLDRQCITMSELNQGRNYEFENNSRVLHGFYAQKIVVVKIKQVSLVYKVLQTLSTDDNIEIAGQVAMCDRREALEQAAREKALLSARKKAEQLASALGMRVGKAITVEENSDDMWRAFTVNQVSTDPADVTKAVDSIGFSVTIAATVDATFELLE